MSLVLSISMRKRLKAELCHCVGKVNSVKFMGAMEHTSINAREQLSYFAFFVPNQEAHSTF